MSQDLIQRIAAFNADRDPRLLPLKYQAMRKDVFAFYRGTCHLFYEDWPAGSPLNAAPPAWAAGDLHLENFGSYQGDNRLVYFDLNDFDEAALAPCTWDLARLVTSVLVAAPILGVALDVAQTLVDACLAAYTATLADGQVCSVERETARGPIKDLLQQVCQRRRATFLATYTEKKGGKRKLCINHRHTFPVTDEQYARVAAALKRWGAEQAHPKFYKLLDVVQRAAGVGSLGVERYLLLVRGSGSPDANYLLDLKAEDQSSLAPYLTLTQPCWAHGADRVCNIQRRMQNTPPALLAALEMDGRSFLLHELQPDEDGIRLHTVQGKQGRLRKLLGTLGAILAWDQVRSSGRQGSAPTDDLIAFARAPQWHAALRDYATSYRERVERDYATFCAAYDAGEMAGVP
ncbi:MAG TPA: DUF2252 family protein [Chloroflexia bacterium]|nr:DUF2252 family protein [Chloroflexia bacterium]